MNKFKFLMALTIVMMSVMSTKAQVQRMNEFQNEFGKYQNQYRDLMHNGNRRDFCTTTMRAAMHWWGKRNRHSRHWSSLFCWATKIIIIW